MPTYEYKCKDCGDRFDVFQNMTDEPLATCSECGGTVKRLIGSGAGIIFKGSGFYCTDYRSDNYQQQASKETTKSTTPKEDTGNTAAKTSQKTTETAKKNEGKPVQ